MLNMEQGTKIATISKQASTDSSPLLDDKVRAQYKIDSKKALIRSLKNGAWVAAAMAFLALISWNFSKIENIFYFSFITTFVSFIILQSRAQTRYKIPHTPYAQPPVSVFSSQHPRYDLDSTIPGSAAYRMHHILDRTH